MPVKKLRLLRKCRIPEPPIGSAPLLPETYRMPPSFRLAARLRLLQESHLLTDMTLLANLS